MDWKKLQNGSDIRGIALNGVEGENINLTPDVCRELGKAFVKWLQVKTGKTGLREICIAIGTDSRLSGQELKMAFMEGVNWCGAEIQDCGLASTPAMFMTTVDDEEPVDGGVMVTASHLPFNRNGLKFFTRNGGLDKNDINDILNYAANNDLPEMIPVGWMHKREFMPKYCQQLVEYIRKGANNGDTPLKGMRIIVDAGNGNGGFFAEDVLTPLGADTTGSQFLIPDGHFPNHIPNPENADAMASICKAVIDSKADLGIIFDTDVDRSAIVDKNGDPINRNTLIALIADVILREHPGSNIVTDSVTSDGLTDFISARGGKHHRFKRGYKNVINEGIRLNNEGEECWLAIETSGHAALKENYFLDDGAYLAAKLVIEAARLNTQGKDLAALITDLKQPEESKEIRFSIHADDFKSYGQQVLEEMTKRLEEEEDWTIVKPNYEGIRVSCSADDEDGWFLLRMSLHDPVMPLNIESNVAGGVEKIEKRLLALMEKYDKLVK